MESTWVVQVRAVDAPGGSSPGEAWFDMATVTVPARSKRKTIIGAGLKKAGLAPGEAIHVRVLDAGSAHVSEVTVEQPEPQLRIA